MIEGVATAITAGRQLSFNVGAGYVTTAPQIFGSFAVVMLAGQTMVGDCVSVMVIVNVQVAVLPDASVAVDVTVVVPTGKKLPDAGTETTVVPGQLSVAVGALNVTTAPHWFAVLEAVIFEGQVILGG